MRYTVVVKDGPIITRKGDKHVVDKETLSIVDDSEKKVSIFPIQNVLYFIVEDN